MEILFECVPNVSEGQDEDRIRRFRDAIAGVESVALLDVESDRDHNRSVFTFVGGREAVRDAVFRLFDAVIPEVDLTKHRGEHPRIGAVDVVPFVPLGEATMEDAVALARDTARGVSERYNLPIYFYEEAATVAHRRNLADIRAGEFEGLAEKMKDPQWLPDLGPSHPHPTAGASVFGARQILIAYNIYLGTHDIEIAKKIAKVVRGSSGGFTAVKALAFEIRERGMVQVSMNLTDYRKSAMHRVFYMVKEEAERYGVPVVSSEIVGMVPLSALVQTAEHYLRLENFHMRQVLDLRVCEAQKEMLRRLQREGENA
ncbi:MAG: glutamate formimidoyltransferase [bacterium JZ-2024 1]